MGSGKGKKSEEPKDAWAEEKKKQKGAPVKKQEKIDENLKYIVRIAGTDLKGTKSILSAIKGIRGISFSFASYCINLLDLDPKRKIGSLSDAETEKIEELIKNPLKFGVPVFALNRRKDLETGKDKHLVGADWDFSVRQDIDTLKKMRCYVGIRHFYGLKLRGQRTGSRGAGQRGRSGRTVGVIRDKLQAARAAASAEKSAAGASPGKDSGKKK